MTLIRRFCNEPPIFRRCSMATAAFFIIFFWVMTFANARDLGQWSNQDAAIRTWFNSLMVPGAPKTSCCGKSDAYWADNFESKDGQYVAVITDTRPPTLSPARAYPSQIAPSYRVKVKIRPATDGYSSSTVSCSAICRPKASKDFSPTLLIYRTGDNSLWVISGHSAIVTSALAPESDIKCVHMECPLAPRVDIYRRWH